MRIDGFVFDTEMRPIAGANVAEYRFGSPAGATARTDQDGHFEIEVQPASDLRFSHASYVYDTVPAQEFESYVNLYSTTLDAVDVTPGKKQRFPWEWLALGTVAAFILGRAAKGTGTRENKPKKIAL